MEAQPGRTDRRRFLLIAGLPLLAVGGLTAYAAWPQPDRPRVRVRTDLEPLESRFGTHVGELTEAHWLGYDIDEGAGDRTVPSPDSRIRLVGVARLAAGGAAAIVRNAEYAFAPAAPTSGLPAPLEQYLPADAAWQHSPQFDAHANRPQSSALPSGAYHFDGARDLVRFDLLYLYT
ncbi:hypothetical protein PV721_03360 [Streptomyces sp. MB09-01]|uniref:hypothetical protein n=1 Tax=Streptomyces sp. MB09-01 TaxID=3028666 RepID=UPI0029A2F807|nr:hypothetical protein [Streptomyces sp. MB09-01]MDX3533423.1 hypothetical protein [Streptomyces sp. MB09-01]